MLYLSTVLLLFFTTLPLIVKILLTTLTVMHFIYVRCSHVIRTFPTAVVGLEWNAQGNFWSLAQANAEEKNAWLLPSSLVTPFMILLKFKDENQSKKSVIVLPDNIGSTDFRRLSVYLRHYGII